MDFETRAIHAGQEPDLATGAVTTPIYQTSTYAQEAVGVNKGYDYARVANPTRTALEECLASLELASYGHAFSSGLGRSRQWRWYRRARTPAVPTATGSTRCPGSGRVGKLGAPRFRSKRDNRQSIRLTRNGFAVRGNGRVYVAKVGDLRVEWSRPLPSVPSSCTVIREADGRYYVSFVVERDAAAVPPSAGGRGRSRPGPARRALRRGGRRQPASPAVRAASPGPGAAGVVPQAARQREPAQGGPPGRRAAP